MTKTASPTLKAAGLFAAIAIALACWLGMGATQAHASGNLQQSAQTTTAVTVTWETAAQGISYREMATQSVQIGTDYDNVKTATPVSIDKNATTYTFTNLKAGVKYYVRVNYTYYYISGSKKELRSDSYQYYSTTIRTLPGKLNNVRQKKWWYWAKSVDVTWDEVNGIDGVKYVFKKSSGKVLKSETKKGYSASVSLSNIKNTKIYTVTVTPYTVINDVTYWGQANSAYLFCQPMLNQGKTYAANGKLVINWNKVSGATSYKVYVSTKEKSGYKKVKTVGKKTSGISIKKFKGKKIKAGKKYYVYIVAKMKVNGKTFTSGKHYTETVQNSSCTTNWTFD